MGLRLITPPAEYPVTLTEMKQHLRVDSTDQDSLIQTYIQAAVDYGEQFTGRAFIDQTWELVLDEFPEHEIQIPKPPLIEIVSVKYDDTTGFETLIASTDYTVDTSNYYGWLVPNDGTSLWPTTFDAINAVRIRFRAGYLDNDSPPEQNVPFEIRAAIMLMTGMFFENREDLVVGDVVNKLPLPAETLLRKYRVLLGFA